MWVLPLDDARWHQLNDAYVPAREFLPHLAELAAAPERATQIANTFAVENYVCHQFCIAETTVAVVPHFVLAASRLPPAGRGRILVEAGYYATLLGVSLGPDTQHIQPDADIGAGYCAAVLEARGLLADVLALPHGELEAINLSAAMAGFQGHQRLATMLFKLRIYERQWCPRCRAEFDPLAVWGRGF